MQMCIISREVLNFERTAAGRNMLSRRLSGLLQSVGLLLSRPLFADVFGQGVLQMVEDMCRPWQIVRRMCEEK